MSQEEIGGRMKAAAEAAGCDPYRVADALGVRPPTVYRWYQGKSRPSNQFMERFAALVGRSAAYLWTGVEELEEMLLRWAELTRQQVGGAEALRQLQGDEGRLSVEEQAMLNSLAPQMIELLNQMAGAAWETLPPDRQRDLMSRLVERLEAWRTRSER